MAALRPGIHRIFEVIATISGVLRSFRTRLALFRAHLSCDAPAFMEDQPVEVEVVPEIRTGC
ncbi:hypothetical protein OA90_27140 [Labrenzia sp. OB1]|nr:hypothetical protein OA90_27140 [Labrenzia sp. OB1]